MPTWGQILSEWSAPENRLPNGQPNTDRVRRKYLAQMAALTGRPVILYATSFLDKPVVATALQIDLGDVQGFMEAINGIDGTSLDLIVTSPGGLAEATESIVSYIRTKFEDIRVFVPVAAMSAATMLALAADEIVMARHSQLGPIDPQFTIMTPEGPRSAPARAILQQFGRAQIECAADPAKLAAWAPILRGYGPGLLQQCVDQQELAENMVRRWLEEFMLKNDPDRIDKAAAAAKWFADYEYFRSHRRRVSLSDVQALGLHGTSLESDQALQDAVLSVHHATAHTFTQTASVKIIENHLGKAWVKIVQEILVSAGPQPAAPQAGQGTQQVGRAERRRERFGRK